jgi:hypothetical protein
MTEVKNVQWLNRLIVTYVQLCSASRNGISQHVLLTEQFDGEVMLWSCLCDVLSSNLGRITGYSD